MHSLLSKSKILVVDDFAQFRQTIKTMLVRLGATAVDQASNAAQALTLCMGNEYDIFLCDYNLGEGQDGQQLLEELHERSILRKGSLFLMVTAETTSAQVMGAIEYSPDTYLTKPFTAEELAQRLKRLILRNEKLQPIHDAINAGKMDKALLLCDLVMAAESVTRFSCLRLKTEILKQQKKYDQAFELLSDVVQQQPLLWAVLGIGQIYFIKQDYENALEHFLQMRKDFPQQVNILDWVAKCYAALVKISEAEEALLDAVKISPKSVRRQVELGRVAQQLEHHDIAQKAFEKTISQGHHSCLLKPEHYKSYFNATQAVSPGLGPREKSRILATCEAAAKRMESKYQGDPTALAVNLSSLSVLFSSVGRANQSDAYLSKLSSALEKPGCLISVADFEHIQQNLNKLGDKKANKRVLGKISNRMKTMKEKIKEWQDNEALAIGINRIGMAYAKKKQLKEALDKFREAYKLSPKNQNFALNAAQLILMQDEFKNDPQLINEARSYLDTLSFENSGAHWKLYTELIGYLPDE
jgi:DNA-binding response OmpR family regulator